MKRKNKSKLIARRKNRTIPADPINCPMLDSYNHKKRCRISGTVFYLHWHQCLPLRLQNTVINFKVIVAELHEPDVRDIF